MQRAFSDHGIGRSISTRAAYAFPQSGVEQWVAGHQSGVGWVAGHQSGVGWVAGHQSGVGWVAGHQSGVEQWVAGHQSGVEQWVAGHQSGVGWVAGHQSGVEQWVAGHQDGASAPTHRPHHTRPYRFCMAQAPIHNVPTTPAPTETEDQLLGDYCGYIFELQAIRFCCK